MSCGIILYEVLLKDWGYLFRKILRGYEISMFKYLCERDYNFFLCSFYDLKMNGCYEKLDFD